MKQKPVILLLLFLSALALFYWVSLAALPGHTNEMDQQIMNWRRTIATPGLISIMKGFSFFGGRLFIFPAYCVVVLLLLLQRHYGYSVIVACTGAVAGLMDGIFKDIYQRSRPALQEVDTLTGYSFPSGHALASFVFGSVLVYITWRSALPVIRKRIISVYIFLFVLLIGISRVILNVHYATDVLGGFLLGAMWVIICYSLTEWYRKMN